MSNLPPRPDFAGPPRNDTRSHHAYRERERDAYMSGRSPPRSRHPSARMSDSYVAPDSRERDRDAYMHRDTYPLPPSYDRREDDRHRGAYRAPDHGWGGKRYAEYSPPQPEYRGREPDPRDWTRDSRDRGRPRLEEAQPTVHIRGQRKSPPRSWTQSDAIDRHPRGTRRDVREDDRRWQPRPGRSPPRRFGESIIVQESLWYSN